MRRGETGHKKALFNKKARLDNLATISVTKFTPRFYPVDIIYFLLIIFN